MAGLDPRRKCGCKRCRGGFVALSTWYRHNLGGSTKRSVVFPKEFTDALLALPETDVVPRARKRRLDEEEEEPMRTPKRASGSSSSVRLSVGDISRHRTYPEMVESPPPTAPLESKQEILVPPHLLQYRAPSSTIPTSNPLLLPLGTPPCSLVISATTSTPKSSSGPPISDPPLIITSNDAHDSRTVTDAASTSNISQNSAPAKGSRKTATKKALQPKQMVASKQICYNEWKEENSEALDDDFEKHWKTLSLVL